MQPGTIQIRSATFLRLLLFAALVLGQCCLTAAHGYAHGLAHDSAMGGHVAAGASKHAVVAVHAAQQPDACCVEAPALASAGTSPAKPPVAAVPVLASAVPAASVAGGATTSRGPPPPHPAARRHVLLQTFQI